MGHILEAYQMIDDVRSIPKEMRTNIDNDNSKTGRVKDAKQIANVVGALEDIKVPRYSACQQHRANVTRYNTSSSVAVGVPFLDHIDQKMIEFKVCKENRQGRDLFFLAPSWYVNAVIYIA